MSKYIKLSIKSLAYGIFGIVVFFGAFLVGNKRDTGQSITYAPDFGPQRAYADAPSYGDTPYYYGDGGGGGGEGGGGGGDCGGEGGGDDGEGG